MPFTTMNPKSSGSPMTIVDDAGYTAATISRSGSTWTATDARDSTIVKSAPTQKECAAKALHELERLVCPDCDRAFSTDLRLKIHRARSHRE